jgi:ABC-type sugar transport system ATPase subunit
MNLFQGKIVREGNAFRFRSSDFSLDLGDTTLDMEAGEVEVGIRPEDIDFRERGGIGLHATVEMVSNVGASKYVHARLGKSVITVRAAKDVSYDTGQPVSLALYPNKLHIFHGGKRIG